MANLQSEIKVNISFESGQDVTKLAEVISEKLLKAVKDVGTYRKVEGRDPKVGDYVKFNSNEDGEPITVGEYYKITEIDWADDPQIIDDSGIEFDCCSEEYEVYELVTGENTSEEQSDEPERLKVGDYAKIIDNDWMDEFNNGDICKVTEVDIGNDTPYYLERISDGDEYWMFAKQVVKATDEEVAQAKAELERKKEEEEREAKWASIGRKVNEFKEGDIVIVKDSPDAKPDGSVFEVKNVSNSYVNDEEGYIYDKYAGHIELVIPVEQRIDRQ